MTRGFTLLELIITVAVLSILLAAAAPSFSSVTQTVQMQRLATELNGFLIQAKSEAVKRNTVLHVQIINTTADDLSNGNWSLKLVDESINLDILYLDGSPFKDITVSHSYSSNSNKISFGKLRGRPSGGNIALTPNNGSNSGLKAVMANPPGRIKICSADGGNYDYPIC